MSSFHFEFLLCLNGHTVPMVKQTLFVIDLGWAEGLEGLVLEEMEADLVPFKSSGEHWWIHQALDFPSKWWVLHSSNIPWLFRIRELIKAKKKALSNRLPKQPDCLVLLNVSDRLLFLQNSTNQLN